MKIKSLIILIISAKFVAPGFSIRIDFFNVDNTANCKYRFSAASLSGSSQIYGAVSNEAQTVCSFERIADAQ